MLKKINNNIYEILLVLLVICFFNHTLYFEFFIFDDTYHLTEDPSMENITWKSFIAIWKTSYMPVIYNIWQAMVVFFGEESPLPYRLLLNLTHAANTVLVFKILQKVLRNSYTVINKSKETLACLLAAIVFAIHPTQVESLLWVSSIKGVMSTLFALIALLLYIKFRSNGDFSKKREFIILFLYALSILCKPSSALLPLVFIAFDKFLFGHTIKDAILRNKLTFSFIIPFTLFFFLRQDKNHIIFITTYYQKLLIFLHSNIFYLKKLVFPFDHTLDYGNSIINILQSYKTTGSQLLLLLKFVLAYAAAAAISFFSSKSKMRMLGIVTFFIFINLVTGLIPYDFQNVSTTADRYMYLPLLGFSLFVMFMVYEIESKLIKYVLGTFLVIFGATTLIFTNRWKESESVLTTSLEKNPESYMINMGLGQIYKNKDELKKAEYFFERASFINPKTLEPHAVLLELFAQTDQSFRGRKHLEFLEKKFEKIPFSLKLFKIDYYLNEKNYKEAKKLIDFYQKIHRNHDLILYRLERLEKELRSNPITNKSS